VKAVAAAFLALLLAPAAARACTVCFGGAGSDMVRGFYWGVILLGSLPFLLIAALFGLIVYHTKKNKQAPSPR
jgi:hypothetical protein